MPTKPLDQDTQLITATGTNTPLDLGTGKGRIAVDMDDVLCQTNVTIVNSKSLSSPGMSLAN
ncbi:hypothetical protein C369_07287 [Cryptococcus neoformans A5-35-17]|nr:hypothetical protein C369_07287 [Cryptococcus neoformans var. grubii A5-35-17]